MELKKQIKDKISKALKSDARKVNDLGGKNIYLNRKIMPISSVLNMGAEKKIILPKKSAIAFIDLAPDYNWGHPCQHVLFDADTGEQYDSIESNFPPIEYYTHRKDFEIIQEEVKLEDRKIKPGKIPRFTNTLTNSRGNRYAILFSGLSDNRHVNDLEFIYRVLINVYGFKPSNIQVLNNNGTLNYSDAPSPIGNWPGDNTPYQMTINGPGSRDELLNAITSLQNKLKEGDQLFIHTNNHGGHDGSQSFLCCWLDQSWEALTASDFGEELAKLPTFDSLMVMMEQCHSGGFMDTVINKSTAKWTHFSAACEEDKSSKGGTNFDPFAYDWIAAVNGQYANGNSLRSIADTHADGRISATEAHNYATAHKHPKDSPVKSEKPHSIGNYMFLGYPNHDLFIRDNLQDYGKEPLVQGGICASPDVIIYNQKLLDPDATLGTEAAKKRNDLGEQVEAGQDNFIYLRVQNRGTQPTSGRAKLYWSPPSTFPTPNSWNFLGEIAIPAIHPNELKVVGPITWHKNQIPAVGHYCFIALVDSGNDPAPNPNTISSLNDFRHFISDNNNATWKNFNVVDMFANSTNSMDFHIQGWPRININTDLKIDVKPLPKTAKVKLRILKRLSKQALPKGLTLVQESALYHEYTVEAGKTCFLKNIKLNPSDNSVAKLEFILPKTITDGNYQIHVAQIVNGIEMGRVTSLISVKEHPYIGNRSTKEIHLPNCKWAKRMNQVRNMVVFDKIERGIKRGYNGCKYCLPKYNTD